MLEPSHCRPTTTSTPASRSMRILLVVGGITLLFGQIVPLWLGRSLLDDAGARTASDNVRTPSTPD